MSYWVLKESLLSQEESTVHKRGKPLQLMHREVAQIQRLENWPTKERHLASPSEKGERSLGIPYSLTVASSSLLSSLFRSLFSFSSSLSFFSFSSFCGLIVGLFHLADGHLGRQRDPYRLTWFFLLVLFCFNVWMPLLCLLHLWYVFIFLCQFRRGGVTLPR